MNARSSSLTDCGLTGIREIPYGVHMCHFYEDADDLAAMLTPYFAAGLRANERCIWIAAEPLPAERAKAVLKQAYPAVEEATRKGGLVIRDFSEWYVQAGVLRGKDVVALWLDEERRALAEGYAGLRITGNVTFLTPETWSDFMNYEELLGQAFHGRHIVTLCTYRVCDSSGAEVLDVMHRHSCALHRPDRGWQILTR